MLKKIQRHSPKHFFSTHRAYFLTKKGERKIFPKPPPPNLNVIEFFLRSFPRIFYGHIWEIFLGLI